MKENSRLDLKKKKKNKHRKRKNKEKTKKEASLLKDLLLFVPVRGQD